MTIVRGDAMRIMAAGKFKAQCLSVIDEVQAKREPVVVTKHGKPVAKVIPLDLAKGEDPLAAFLFPGKVKTIGDIVSPTSLLEKWDAQ